MGEHEPGGPGELEMSVVIVNHNGGGFLPAAIGALQENTVCDRAEIIVVDSASTDHSAEHLSPGRLPVRVLRYEENVGFCRGNNLGAAAARGDVLAFTQPDGAVQPGWDESLRAALLSAGVAAVGGIVMQASGDVIDSAGMRIAPNFAGWSLGETLTCEEAGLRAGHHRYVVGLSPAFLMVRRADHLRIGGFWEELWMYGDEADYAVRIGRLGRCVLCPESRMHHSVGGSAGPHQSPLRLYWSSRNRLLNAARHLPLPRLVLAVLMSAGFDGLQLLQQRTWGATAAIVRGWVAGLRGMRAARRLGSAAERRHAAACLSTLRDALAQQRALGRSSPARRT